MLPGPLPWGHLLRLRLLRPLRCRRRLLQVRLRGNDLDRRLCDLRLWGRLRCGLPMRQRSPDQVEPITVLANSEACPLQVVSEPRPNSCGIDRAATLGQNRDQLLHRRPLTESIDQSRELAPDLRGLDLSRGLIGDGLRYPSSLRLGLLRGIRHLCLLWVVDNHDLDSRHEPRPKGDDAFDTL